VHVLLWSSSSSSSSALSNVVARWTWCQFEYECGGRFETKVMFLGRRELNPSFL
jgi:hypothetical protein